MIPTSRRTEKMLLIKTIRVKNLATMKTLKALAQNNLTITWMKTNSTKVISESPRSLREVNTGTTNFFSMKKRNGPKGLNGSRR
jgi:hypothetical protein